MSMENSIEDDPFGDQTPTTVVPSTLPAAPAEDQPINLPAGSPIAGGRREPILPPAKLPEWSDPYEQDLDDSAETGPDYSDLMGVNRDLNQLRIRMSRVRRQMRKAGREAITAKLNYQRKFRRALIQQTGGTAESRKAAAEIAVEEIEADMVMKQQVADEYNTLFRSVRDDIENAKVVAYNLRAIQSIM